MALFFPTRSTCRFDSPGERRLAERLDKKLNDDFLCWFNVPVGPKALQPDFVILHPQWGLLVLEVKDWRLDTIQSMDKGTAQIIDNGSLKKVKNPLTQARVYALEVVMALQKDPELRQPLDTPYAGNLAIPWGFGVVLTSITRKQFEQTELAAVMDPKKVLFQDEMTESVEPNELHKKLTGMLPPVFRCNLSKSQIDRIRYHLFPEVRVNSEPGQFGLFAETEAPLPDLIKVMDLQQELLARSMGEGHRVIHGVAGSGKTMILGYRCAYLASATSKPILVLCFNRSLAGRLNQVMSNKGLKEKVVVRSFHAWCREQLTASGIPLPEKCAINEKMNKFVQLTISAVEEGIISKEQYSAVLIDEGHDFEPDWLRLAVKMVDSRTNSLLLLFDDAQSIYRSKNSKERLGFTFASVGIQAPGRTTVLKLNYRNTAETLAVAKALSTDLLAEKSGSEESIPTIAPESAGRRGKVPELLRFQSEEAEWNCITERIKDAQGQGRQLSDIAIIYRSQSHGVRAEEVLRREGIPFSSGLSQKGKGTLYTDRDTVKIISMHSSKGLEFGVVFIPSMQSMPQNDTDEIDEARLAYVAMTRATEYLVMTHSKDSIFTTRIQEAIERASRQKQ
ncbi:DNA helicase [Pseudomonas tohonis]|uniref:DNA 3'-5' helicase II n=1 Tax=Pseudomonas tohonis TaxID=2725477 RepID=A0A6J4EC15_9PSED|nr:3'-5' exonuclease [Pseudomonas tohonis]BCG26978.1 DNA helicase [Pseudomonas tohonis]GJN50286.1 DNA helicase [Pseudomonas tohonis]